MQLVSRINKAFNLSVMVSWAFKNATVAEQAASIMEDAVSLKTYQPILKLNALEGEAPLFLVHPAEGGAEVYQDSSLLFKNANELISAVYGVEHYNFSHLDQAISKWKGGIYLEVPAPYASQTCSVCGAKDKASRQSQERYQCTSCGYEANADINAAKNILAAGHAVLACGEDALAASMKQEPLEKSNLVPA